MIREKKYYLSSKGFISWNFLSIKIIPVTEAEVESLIHSVKHEKKSLSYDEITSKILKACASLISHPLSYIYNSSLCKVFFLTLLKLR
jgi:hypothetical protein